MDNTGSNGSSPADNNLINHFVNLLETEAGIYEKYIDLATKEKEAIARGDDEKLMAYMEFESAYLKETESYDTVIATFDKLFTGRNLEPVREIDDLKSRISVLHMKLCSLNRENQAALQEKMAFLKCEMEAVARNRTGRTISFKKPLQPRYIDTDA